MVAQHSPRVGILIGSSSDREVMDGAVAVLKKLDIPCEMLVRSAHRTPEQTRAYVESARQRGIGVLIAAAGMAAHLAGAVAAHTTLPVIGVPIASGPLQGQDALLATVQMPAGIPVATVAIDGAKNAAYLAAQILAVSDADIAARLAAERAERAEAILAEPTVQG
ncbi:MAG: 5-(carboxyamino)imidazole ribonucleotide mutase [Deltaproteobacteria bacterium]|nr:5-(carboxyamino)imidazole ribonucleotide mutase [Deltaproteobacteria bacterium]